MVGIEPTSESTSVRIFSERSLRLLRPEGGTFASALRHRRSRASAISWFPYATENSHRVFLHIWRRDPVLQVRPGRRRGRL